MLYKIFFNNIILGFTIPIVFFWGGGAVLAQGCDTKCRFPKYRIHGTSKLRSCRCNICEDLRLGCLLRLLFGGYIWIRIQIKDFVPIWIRIQDYAINVERNCKNKMSPKDIFSQLRLYVILCVDPDPGLCYQC